MFNTKQLVFTEKDVPSNWVFEYYLDLPEKLTGQDVKIKSIFNPNERTPSMCIFVDQINAQYKYKDFSSGKFGSKIDLVKELFHVGYPGAVEKIIEDFNSFIKNNEFLNTNFKAQENAFDSPQCESAVAHSDTVATKYGTFHLFDIHWSYL